MSLWACFPCDNAILQQITTKSKQIINRKNRCIFIRLCIQEKESIFAGNTRKNMRILSAYVYIYAKQAQDKNICMNKQIPPQGECYTIISGRGNPVSIPKIKRDYSILHILQCHEYPKIQKGLFSPIHCLKSITSVDNTHPSHRHSSYRPNFFLSFLLFFLY